MVGIQIPKAKLNASAAYHKIERKVGDYATAGVAVALELTSSGICEQAGIGLTNVSSVPMRASRAEEILKGKEITTAIMEEAADVCSQDCQPSDDLRRNRSLQTSGCQRTYCAHDRKNHLSGSKLNLNYRRRNKEEYKLWILQLKLR